MLIAFYFNILPMKQQRGNLFLRQILLTNEFECTSEYKDSNHKSISCRLHPTFAPHAQILFRIFGLVKPQMSNENLPFSDIQHPHQKKQSVGWA